MESFVNIVLLQGESHGVIYSLLYQTYNDTSCVPIGLMVRDLQCLV